MKTNPKSKFFLSILALSVVSTWMAVMFFPDNDLKIIACDVGQGDATLVKYAQNDILIDGGPDSSVIRCLDRYIPFWDRTIDLVILSHPQKDHFLGLIEVFKKYKVKKFIVTELNSDTQEYRVLKELVGGSDTLVIRPKTGMKIRLGLIYLDILHPSEKFFKDNFAVNLPAPEILGVYSTNRNENDFSVVFSLRYKDFDALFTGDIGPEVMDEVLKSRIEDVEYLKVPHHGSKNGLTKELLEKSTPEIAVISSGKDNPHGHPHRELIELLSDQGIKILRTDEMGDVVISTDGEKVKLDI